MSLILGSMGQWANKTTTNHFPIRPLTQMLRNQPDTIKHDNIIPRIKVPNMLKAHGDAKTFEIGQVRLNIEGIT